MRESDVPILTWLKDISLSVCGPRSIMACKGPSVRNIPVSLRSPKYSRLASSRPSCHISCHRIATLMSSSDTCKIRNVRSYGMLNSNWVTCSYHLQITGDHHVIK